MNEWTCPYCGGKNHRRAEVGPVVIALCPKNVVSWSKDDE